MDLMKNKIRNFLLSLLFFSPVTSLRSEELKVAPAVPLSQEDLKDPQSGYIHMPYGMEGGTFFYGKKGTQMGNMERLELDKFDFLEGFRTEVAEGFTPSIGACIYMDKWTCIISNSEEAVFKKKMDYF